MHARPHELHSLSLRFAHPLCARARARARVRVRTCACGGGDELASLNEEMGKLSSAAADTPRRTLSSATSCSYLSVAGLGPGAAVPQCVSPLACVRCDGACIKTGTAQAQPCTYDKLGWMKLAAPAAPNVYCEVCSRLKTTLAIAPLASRTPPSS